MQKRLLLKSHFTVFYMEEIALLLSVQKLFQTINLEAGISNLFLIRSCRFFKCYNPSQNFSKPIISIYPCFRPQKRQSLFCLIPPWRHYLRTGFVSDDKARIKLFEGDLQRLPNEFSKFPFQGIMLSLR